MLKTVKKGQQIYPQQDLADRLRDALEEAGVSQADLARACGVTDQAVWDWLRTGRVGKQHLVTLCHLTKKPLEYFLVGLQTWRRVAALALPFLSLAPLSVALLDALRSIGCVLCQMPITHSSIKDQGKRIGGLDKRNVGKFRTA